jgi:hypothetical protein
MGYLIPDRFNLVQRIKALTTSITPVNPVSVAREIILDSIGRREISEIFQGLGGKTYCTISGCTECGKCSVIDKKVSARPDNPVQYRFSKNSIMRL